MIGRKNQSALLAKYYGMYKKNPRSKVFAPLAESYRKLGMLDDAFKILKDGIRNHPNYVLGYIVLAHCYYDQQKYELTYNTLRPIVGQNADNISLQKIFAQACMHLGHLEEALDTYKYLLFLNPRDKNFAEQVKKLEDDLYVGHKKLSLEQIVRAPEMSHLPQPQTLDDDWVQVDFNTSEDGRDKVPEAKDDHWSMKAPGSLSIFEESSIKARDLEDDFFADEFEDEGNVEDTTPEIGESPIVSHTLIDLYCAQHYFDKAIELLQKIIELNPKDKLSVEKLSEVIKLKAQSETSTGTGSEEDGHLELLSLIETKVKVRTPNEQKLTDTLAHFLSALKERAQQYR